MSIIQAIIGTNLTISGNGGGGGGAGVYPPTLSATSGSMRFAPITNDYYHVESDPQDWAVGTGNYTIEWYQWMLETSNGAARPFSVGTWPSAVLALSIENGTCYLWGENNTSGMGNNMVGSFGYNASDYFNTWVHIAISRVSGVTYILFNGEQVFSTGQTYNITNSGGQALTIGNQGNPNTGGSFVGYIKDFRFIKGVGLYNGAFTPPKYPLTATAETVLLLSVNDSNNVMTDSSGRYHTGTAGGVYWSDVSPYGIALEVDVTDPASYDSNNPTVWSDLSPNGNHITLTNVTQLQQGYLRFGTTGMGETVGYSFPEQSGITPRMSISYWANIKYTGNYQHIVGCRSTNMFHSLLLGYNVMEARTQTTNGFWDLLPDMSSHIGNAVHCAFVVNGDRADFYVNGVLQDTTTNITGNFTGQLGPLYLASVEGAFQSENLDLGYVRVDNRARDPKEIAREFAAKRTYYNV